MTNKLPLDMHGVARKLAAGHLFNVSDSADMFDEDKVQKFHHLVAKFSYLSCMC